MTRGFFAPLFALCLVGCTDVSSPPGTGGVGGSGGVGGAAATGGNGGGGTGGDALVCDDGLSDLDDNTLCTPCINCAAVGPCSQQVGRCEGSAFCTSFVNCLDACGEMGGEDSVILACIDGCVAANPEGASMFEIGQSCTFCECPNNCESFDQCRDVLECDDGTIPALDEPEICETCISCAAAGPCKPSSDACDASTECDDFINCEIACQNDGGDVESCFTSCSATHPAGAALARDNTTCLCAQCPSNCTGAPSCDFY